MKHKALEKNNDGAMRETMLPAAVDTKTNPEPENPKTTPIHPDKPTLEVPNPDALTLARAIAAVNDLPLPPEAKADLIRRLAGL